MGHDKNEIAIFSRNRIVWAISAIIYENAFDYLDAPVKRICELDTPISLSPVMEDHVIPNETRIKCN